MSGARAASLVLSLVVAACAPAAASVPTPAALPAAQPVAREAVAPDPAPTPKQIRFRLFVASEMTQKVWVFDGPDPLVPIARIGVGKLPHNISVSPDGKWVAVANRLGGSASVIDPLGLKEVARVKVGRQPHDLVWAPDSSVLYVGSEREGFIHRIEAGSWKPLSPLAVQEPQHTLALSSDRPNELWLTLTNTEAIPHLRVYHLDSGRITKVQAFGVHDVYFSPDGSEVWSSSSGFLCKPSDRMLILDPELKKVKQEVRFAGRYPFHTMKQNRDALFYKDQTRTMVLSDHQGEALLLVDWKERRIVGEAKLRDPELPAKGKCGIEVFHTAYSPGRYYTTSNKDDSLRIIDAQTLAVLQRVEVTTPHGVVLVPLQ